MLVLELLVLAKKRGCVFCIDQNIWVAKTYLQLEEFFSNWLYKKKINYIKSNKNKTSYINKKMQIHKILQFPFTNFLILKSLHDSFIIKMLQTTHFSKF